MRVIGGQYRSRRLKTLKGLDVRPTPDRLREALFNVLGARVAGAVFVDAYAGCGSVGIEALSRGAGRVVFIERKHAAMQVIRENLRTLGIEKGFEIIHGKVSARLPRVAADIVFLDPPYPLVKEYDAALGALGDAPPELVIAQHASRHTLREAYGALRRTRQLRHGDNTLTFFAPDGL